MNSEAGNIALLESLRCFAAPHLHPLYELPLLNCSVGSTGWGTAFHRYMLAVPSLVSVLKLVWYVPCRGRVWFSMEGVDS